MHIASQALAEVLPSVAAKKVAKGGFLILRPDSGDPLEAVLAALHAAEKVFGADVNQKGYKVPKGCGVIQGDGIGYDSLSKIIDGVIDAGFSLEVMGAVIDLSFYLKLAVVPCQPVHVKVCSIFHGEPWCAMPCHLACCCL